MTRRWCAARPRSKLKTRPCVPQAGDAQAEAVCGGQTNGGHRESQPAWPVPDAEEGPPVPEGAQQVLRSPSPGRGLHATVPETRGQAVQGGAGESWLDGGLHATVPETCRQAARWVMIRWRITCSSTRKSWQQCQKDVNKLQGTCFVLVTQAVIQGSGDVLFWSCRQSFRGLMMCFVLQACLVYAIGIDLYTFEAQTTHLCLHYANDFIWAMRSNKRDWVVCLTQSSCWKGTCAPLWYTDIKSCNSAAAAGANIGSERSQNSLQLGENGQVEEASEWNFFRRWFSVHHRRLCCCN